MVVRFLIVFVLFISAGPMVSGQGSYSISDKKAIKFYEESAVLLRERNFDAAVEVLQKALLRAPDFVEAHLRLAGTYKLILKNELAENHYRQAIEADPNNSKNLDAYFALGQLLFEQGNYTEAEKHLKKYAAARPPNQGKVNIAIDLLAQIDYAFKLMEDPLPFDPQPLPAPLNQFAMQYFPVLTADGKQIFFTVRKGNSSAHDEDVYTSVKDAEGNWSAPVSISNSINTPRNEGTCTISADGKTLIFTSCQAPDSFGSCDLYEVKRTGDAWGMPKNMGQPINTPGWESQPSLSADGRMLYFVSDRKGGQGRRDIWVSRLSPRGNWLSPENLGPVINTANDDLSPFIHVNGQSLYFSSSGHLGVGKFDLFLSELTEQQWSEPKNLGYPINTPDDQVSLVITADGTTAYYAHEVLQPDGNYVSTLYSFVVPEEVRVRNKSNFLTGRVLDKETHKPLAASIEMFDINNADLNYKVKSDEADGRYFIVLTEGKEYSIYVSRKGYLFENLTYNYIEKKSREPEVLDIYLTPIKSGASSVLKNIFFDVDQYTLKEKSKTELAEIVRFLKENESISVEIAGHTDNTGSDLHNTELSTNRARSVYDFLVKAGIAKERLQYQGYGSKQPKAPNDSEANRQLNRRIEFKVL